MGIKTSNFKDVDEFVQWVNKHGDDYYQEYKDKVIDWRTELDDGSYTVKRFNGVAFKPNTIYLVRNWNIHYDRDDYYFYYWRPNFIKSDTYYNPKYYTPHEGYLIRVDGQEVGGGFGFNIPETVENISIKWIEMPKTTFLNWNFNPLYENIK